MSFGETPAAGDVVTRGQLEQFLDSRIGPVAQQIRQLQGAGPASQVTTLPSSPRHGQEVYYVADDTNGVVWHLRYDSGAPGAYKWRMLGGGAMRVEQVGGRDWTVTETTASVTDTTLATAGPSIVVPLAGDYEIEGSAGAIVDAGALGAPALFIVATGDAVLSWTLADALFYGPAGAVDKMRARKTRAALAASTTVSLHYATSNAGGAAAFYNRSLWLRPVQVG